MSTDKYSIAAHYVYNLSVEAQEAALAVKKSFDEIELHMRKAKPNHFELNRIKHCCLEIGELTSTIQYWAKVSYISSQEKDKQ